MQVVAAAVVVDCVLVQLGTDYHCLLGYCYHKSVQRTEQMTMKREPHFRNTESCHCTQAEVLECALGYELCDQGGYQYVHHVHDHNYVH